MGYNLYKLYKLYALYPYVGGESRSVTKADIQAPGYTTINDTSFEASGFPGGLRMGRFDR